MPLFKALLGDASAQGLHDGLKSCHARIFAAKQSSEIEQLERPCSRGFLAFRIAMMTKFFQLGRLSTLATEMLKSSIWKDKL